MVGLSTPIFMSPQPGQLNTLLKFSSGGTCEILSPGQTQIGIGVFLGTTQANGVGMSLVGTGYAFSAGEVITISGPASYYLVSSGATSILHAIYGKGQGL